jgi:hypothetical protein
MLMRDGTNSAFALLTYVLYMGKIFRISCCADKKLYHWCDALPGKGLEGASRQYGRG